MILIFKLAIVVMLITAANCMVQCICVTGSILFVQHLKPKNVIMYAVQYIIYADCIP